MATYNISISAGTGISQFTFYYYDSSNTYRGPITSSSITVPVYSGTDVYVSSVTFRSGYTYPVTCGGWTMYNSSGSAVDPYIRSNANRSLTISATQKASTAKGSVTIDMGTGISNYSFTYYLDGELRSDYSTAARRTIAADVGTDITITGFTYSASYYGTPVDFAEYTSTAHTTLVTRWDYPGDPLIRVKSTPRYFVFTASIKEQTYYGQLRLNANGGYYGSGLGSSVSILSPGAPNAVSGVGGAIMTLYVPTGNKPTRDGYTFVGYATTSNATEVDYYGGDGVTFTARSTSSSSPTIVDLYAVWKQTFTLTFATSYSGVTNMPSNVENITSGTGVTIPSITPVKHGYTFVGWARTDGGTATLFAGSTVYVTANVTLWTVFEKIQVDTFYWWGNDAIDGNLIAKGKEVKAGITANGWNNLNAKIKELSELCGVPFSYTQMISGNEITAARFNAARTGINNIRIALGAYTQLPYEQSSGGTVFATLFNGTISLKGALNLLIGVYNNDG